MNIAYSRYLQNALEHSTLTDEEKQGAHAFLKFLSTYKPTGLNVREPDFYGYGDAFGQYGVTYFDQQTLEDYGIDPDKLDAPQLDQLMTRWTAAGRSAGMRRRSRGGIRARSPTASTRRRSRMRARSTR